MKSKLIILLCVVVVAVVGFLLFSGDRKEKLYETAINEIEEKDWSSAASTLQSITITEDDYEDATVLEIYVNAQRNHQTSYGEETDYRELLANLDQIPKDYSGVYSEDIKTFKGMVSSEQSKLDSIRKEENFNTALELFAVEEYEAALDLLYDADHPDIDTILLYVNAMNYKDQWHKNSFKEHYIEKYYENLNKIEHDYTGLLSENILTEVNLRGGWDSIKESLDVYQYTSERKENPTIGMTESEVSASSWGRPMDINRTTTKYGTDEQWVYASNKYIYLENGVVTAIQE